MPELALLANAMHERRSARTFTDEPLGEEAIAALQDIICSANEVDQLDIELILDEPEAFACPKARKKGFSGVRNYIVMLGSEFIDVDEACGYQGQKLVLLAHILGLRTCWEAQAYRIVQGAYGVDLGQKLVALIALGHSDDEGEVPALKQPEDISWGYESAPDWFRCGVDAALLAPTISDQPKFRFKLAGEDDAGVPLVKVTTRPGRYAKVDAGIARYHFEIGTGSDLFAWA